MSSGGNPKRTAAAAVAQSVVSGVDAEGSVPSVPEVSLPPEVQAELDRRRAMLDQAELELAERALDLAEREEQSKADAAARGMQVRREDAPMTGPQGGYAFLVGISERQQADYPTLAPVRVMAIDEAEAKRWFIATHEDPKRKGKQVDPVTYDIVVKCVDDGKRQASVNSQYELAAIRRKREAGTQLTEQEEAKLTLAERAMPVL